MDKRLSIEWCGDSKSYGYGYVFRCDGQIVAKCDESDYHEILNNLLGDDANDERL